MKENRSLAVKNGGFTLIELLVVMSIIALLSGLSAWAVLRGRLRGEESATKANLMSLVAGIEQHATEVGDYPPSSLAAYGVAGNGINEGIECLLASLQTRRYNGPFIGDLDPDQRSNTDEDRLSDTDAQKLKARLDWTRNTDQLFEYSDLWGNPLVYIHSRDYGKKFKIRLFDRRVVEVEAARDPETGGYYKPTEFQLYSIGADGVPHNGGEDDVCHWKR